MSAEEEPRMVQRIDTFRDLTVQELVDWCLQRGLTPSAVAATGGHLKWMSPETEPERERREAYHAASMARHEEWERETYERLRVKFEPRVIHVNGPEQTE